MPYQFYPTRGTSWEWGVVFPLFRCDDMTATFETFGLNVGVDFVQSLTKHFDHKNGNTSFAIFIFAEMLQSVCVCVCPPSGFVSTV